MRRYTIRVILIGLVATIIWWATSAWTRVTTIAAAKGLHTLVGYPAPYLLADLDNYYWFAPLFPPLLALVLAARWVPWRQRLAGLAVGLAGFWYLVALQIALVYSPYLTLSAVRAYLTSIQVALNSVVVPVVLWLIITRGPPGIWSQNGTAGPKPDTASQRRSESPRLVVTALLVLLLCAVMTMPVPPATAQTTPTLSTARKSVASAITGGQPRAALDAIDTMFTAQSHNAALSYLQLQLYRRLGDRQAVRRTTAKALTTSRRRAAYRTSRP